DLDSRTPELKSKRIPAGGSHLVNFSNAVWLALNDVARGGEVTLQITDQLPPIPSSFSLTWPVAAYAVKFTGALEKESGAEISMYLPGLKHGRYGFDPRFLEWDGKRYRDLTYAVDFGSEMIVGTAARLGTYVIMDRHEKYGNK